MKLLNSIMLLFIVGLATIVLSCSQKTGKKEEGQTVNQIEKKEKVKVIILQEEEIARSIEYSSSFDAFNEVHLAPATPGKIENIFVEVGDKVTKGESLVKMDDSQLIQSKIQTGNLRTDFSRMDTLRKVGSIAEQQYDEMATQYKTAQENLSYLEENTLITAPFSGVISGKYFENGEIYSGSPITGVGKAAIVSLIEIDKLKAIVSISEKYFPGIKKGMETTVKADVYPGHEFTGKIYRIYPTIDQETRTFDVEVSIDNSQNLLRPGMFCRITIDMEKVNTLVLPAIAVLKMQGSNVRYLFVDDNGTAKRVDVELGKRFDDKVEVISDKLAQGDKIIISGQERLLDKMKIEVVE